jgi:hypothetical protein
VAVVSLPPWASWGAIPEALTRTKESAYSRKRCSATMRASRPLLRAGGAPEPPCRGRTNFCVERKEAYGRKRDLIPPLEKLRRSYLRQKKHPKGKTEVSVIQLARIKPAIAASPPPRNNSSADEHASLGGFVKESFKNTALQ